MTRATEDRHLWRPLPAPMGLKLALVALCCLAAAGCTRKYWRKQADELSYNVIRDKQSDPRWVVDRVRVETDPRSRFYEAFDPDFEPLPPDDLAAHEYMHWVYGRRGWKHWHEFGDQASVDNPHWLEPFGMPRDVVEGNMGRPGQWPAMNLTLEDAIDLSYIHSRDYQTQIENVYLAALALTLQRFAFDVQFVGLNGRPSSSLTYENAPGNSSSLLLNPSVGVSQLLPTGGEWLVNLANNTLWLFSNGGTQSSASTLSYSLVQPLLANGGRRFVMEGLTQSERNLLYSVRDLARFRMGFFSSTVAGGFTAGITVGIQGVFSGTGPIPTAVPNFAGANGGFLGLLQLYQTVANTEYNIRQLREQLDRLRAQAAERPEEISEPLAQLPPGVAIPAIMAGKIRYDADEKQLVLRGQLLDIEAHALLQLSQDRAYQAAVTALLDRSNILTTTNQNIVQLETQLANNLNQLRSARVSYLNGLDQYKLQLGLPIDMPLTLDLSLLKPFELVDPRLTRLQDRLNAFVLEVSPPPDDHPDAAAMSRVTRLMQQLGAERDDPSLAVLRGIVDEMRTIRDDLKREGVDVTDEDFRRVAEHQQRTANSPKIDNEMQIRRDPERDARLKAALLEEFLESDNELNKLREELSQDELPLQRRQDALAVLADLREDFLKISQSLSVVQINLRVDLIDLNPWNMSMDETVAVGLANRLDLMNQRAAVMDSRRKVEVAANQLQAIVNLSGTGSINTKPLSAGINNPFDFRSDQSNFQVGVQFTTPVQLVSQRNAYRAALVGYQQARRNYQRTEDQVKLDCRTNWRQLDINRRNFETLREQVRAATAQLDIAAEQSAAPAPAAPAAGAAGGGGGQQAQGLQILQAVQSVLTAQNNLIQFWVGYEAFRLDMHNFMGTLEIDPEGYWTDEFYQARARIHRANPQRLYPPVDGPGGYGSPTDSGEVNNGAYADNSARAAPSPPTAQVALPPVPDPPTGRIRLAGAESPAKPNAKRGATTALRRVEPSGPENPSSYSTDAPGRARLGR